MIAGECTWSSERAWNSVGRRRVYVQTGPNEYSELRYVQPALNFDVKTGLPTEDAGEASEHIMVDFWKVSRIKGAFQHPLKAYTNGAIHGPEMHSKTRPHTTPMCSMLLIYEVSSIFLCS